MSNPKLSEYLKKNGTWWERQAKPNPGAKVFCVTCRRYKSRLKEHKCGKPVLPIPGLARRLEQEALPKLQPYFDKIWSAARICDFIAVKDGQIYLVETKAFGSRNRLSPLQKEAQIFFGDKYEVRNYEGVQY